MSLELSIENIFPDMEKLINEIGRSKMPVVTRQALNRTIAKANTYSSRVVTNRFNIKKKTLKGEKLLSVYKASGRDYSSMVATIYFSRKPLSLIRFISDKNKKETDQKGIKIKKRKALRVKVGRKTSVRNKAFIRKGKNGNLHVFSRGSDNKLIKQSAPSLASMFKDSRQDLKFKKFVGKAFQKEFITRVNYELSKIRGSK